MNNISFFASKPKKGLYNQTFYPKNSPNYSKLPEIKRSPKKNFRSTSTHIGKKCMFVMDKPRSPEKSSGEKAGGTKLPPGVGKKEKGKPEQKKSKIRKSSSIPKISTNQQLVFSKNDDFKKRTVKFHSRNEKESKKRNSNKQMLGDDNKEANVPEPNSPSVRLAQIKKIKKSSTIKKKRSKMDVVKKKTVQFEEEEKELVL